MINLHEYKRLAIIGFYPLLIILCSVSLVQGQFTQDEQFGKNRVQFHDQFKYWWSYESDNFITYWISPARKPAEAAVLMAEKNYQIIQQALEHHINNKVKIMVFSDLTDLKQSNLGTSELFELKPGETKVDRDRIFVYFDGNHAHLDQQIREGIANVHINFMLQGNSIQQFVRSNFYNSLPEWFIPGLISYVSDPTNYDFEQGMRQWFDQEEDNDFDRMVLFDRKLAGHALWNYINVRYGQRQLSNLLYISRINRQIDQSFQYVLGDSQDEVKAACYDFYRGLYAHASGIYQAPDATSIKIKKKKRSRNNYGGYSMHVTDVEISPTGDQILYVTNEIGRYRAWIYDVASGRQFKLLAGGYKNPFQKYDDQYPQFRWDPQSNELFVIEEIRDRIILRKWDADFHRTIDQVMPPTIERVYSFDVLGKDSLIMSANTDGYADLYIYRPKNRQVTRLSQDFYDDLEPQVVRIDGFRYVAFRSNRPNEMFGRQTLDTLLPNQSFDLFLLAPSSGFIQRLTNTPHASEVQLNVNGSYLHYLSDENGIYNRWKVDLAAESLTHSMSSSYRSDIHQFDVSNEWIVESIRLGNDVQIKYLVNDESSSVNVTYTPMAQLLRRQESSTIETKLPLKPVKTPDNEGVKYNFQSPFDEEIPVHIRSHQSLKEDQLAKLLIPDFNSSTSLGKNVDNKHKAFNSSRLLAYRLTFGLTDFDFDVNNDLLFTGLNSFAGFNRGFEYPSLGILARGESRDLLENYVVSGAGRVPLSFDGTEFYLGIEDRRRQLDKKLSIYRRSNRENNDDRFADRPDTKNITHMSVFELKYPFSSFSSLRLMTTLRFDRTIFLPEEPGELDRDNIAQQRIGLRLEYVFDNSYLTLPNIRVGTRAKFYVEGMNRFRLQFDPWTFNSSEAFMTVVGFDARHYMRLDRHSILAARIAGASSLGSEKILYSMGGVRNWLSPSYNTSTPAPNSSNFAFQAAALEMRGFDQNVRNGASFVLSNVELRVPLFNYLSKYELKSKFLREFQLISFADVGTAWHGTSPYDEENSLNEQVLTNPLVQANVRYFRDPLIFGYGVGARITILGYVVRVDYAWGIESRERLDPKLYVSLGYDF